MDKYLQLKRFNNDRRLQVYMYAFMYVDHETISVEEIFPDKKNIAENYKKISNPAPVPNHCIGISYICS